MAEFVIYTAITSNKDTLNEPAHILPNTDYICFTDNPALRSQSFEIRPLPFTEKTSRLTARKLKLLPHMLFPNHQSSLWIDASRHIRRDLTPLLAQLRHAELAAFTHPARDCLYEEITTCIRTGRDHAPALLAQAAHYRQQNMPEHHGLWETSMLFRRHTEMNAGLMNTWWHELQHFSARDQVSLPYILWKFGASLHSLDYRTWHDTCFIQHPHNWNPPGDSRNRTTARLHNLWWRMLQRAHLSTPYERIMRLLKKALS